jgi:hypothetical protein
LTITLWDNLNFTSYDADLFTKLYEMISIFWNVSFSLCSWLLLYGII